MQMVVSSTTNHSEVTMVLKETQDYELSVAEDENKKLYYSVCNKVTGVEEADTTMLPRAFGYILQLQAGVDAERSGAFDVKKDPIPSIGLN